MNGKKYRCKERFCVELYDDGGFQIMDKEKVIEAGEEYILDESGSTIIGGEVHLDKEDGSWLELSRESFEFLFELVEEVENE